MYVYGSVGECADSLFKDTLHRSLCVRDQLLDTGWLRIVRVHAYRTSCTQRIKYKTPSKLAGVCVCVCVFKDLSKAGVLLLLGCGMYCTQFLLEFP